MNRRMMNQTNLQTYPAPLRVVAGSLRTPKLQLHCKCNINTLRVVAGSTPYAKYNKNITHRVTLPAFAGSSRQTTRKNKSIILNSYLTCGELRVVNSTVSRFFYSSSNTLSKTYIEPVGKTTRNSPQTQKKSCNHTFSLNNSLRVVGFQLPANLLTNHNHKGICQ